MFPVREFASLMHRTFWTPTSVLVHISVFVSNKKRNPIKTNFWISSSSLSIQIGGAGPAKNYSHRWTYAISLISHKTSVRSPGALPEAVVFAGTTYKKLRWMPTNILPWLRINIRCDDKILLWREFSLFALLIRKSISPIFNVLWRHIVVKEELHTEHQILRGWAEK